MDNRHEVREFLQARRAKVAPELAGLPAGGARRVAGLRRRDVAALTWMSAEYYAKVERGALAGASAGVLESLARGLLASWAATHGTEQGNGRPTKTYEPPASCASRSSPAPSAPDPGPERRE